MTASDEESLISKIHYHYWLFPDWQTSYLWYDNQGPLSSSGQSHVDADVIKGQYFFLNLFYFEWQKIYESVFEQQKCHLDSDKEVFVEIHE